MNDIKRYNHPLMFYILAAGIPWLLWSIAGYYSHIEPTTQSISMIMSTLGILGLAAPMIIAGTFFLYQKELRLDLWDRLFNLRSIRPHYAFITCFLMLSSILLAQGISLLFGYPVDQFQLAHSPSFSTGLFPTWVILLLAPILEELAWHSYGTDALRSRWNLFISSMVFAIYWFFWHVPLSFIKNYYQSNLVDLGPIHYINFGLSLIPYVLIMNWLYYKTNRNILVTIIFHMTANVFNEIFATHPDAKVIQTGLLFILSVILLWKDPKLFFSRKFSSEPLATDHNIGLLDTSMIKVR